MEIECTQRLDCTQEQYTQPERIEPEQIGFLGICGAKYPVKKGPNKIGRDPQTCRIVLNLNSISRQHAVINVLNLNEFMLMDLDSANKTKLQGKTLQPFIPHPLKNGDMVQFGDVFGVFRLLEDDNDLPMTQAIDIPCTPVPVAKQVSRCGAPSVLVPESPEVSDKDDSFIMPSQPKPSTEFKSPMNKFLKPSNKTVAIQPMGSKKIDNAYWHSGKKSESFNFSLDDSGSSLDDAKNSNLSNKVIDESAENIHEMETQEPYKADDSTDSIYTANTQLPPTPVHLLETQQPLPDIHGLETQQFADIDTLNTQNIPDIHECATQVPPVCKVNVQENVQFDLYTANKENDNSIFNAETQVFPIEKETISSEAKKPESLNVTAHGTSKEKNDSDEEIVFDEINTQSFHEEFESQPLLPDDVSPQIKSIERIELSSKNIPNKSSGLPDCDDFDILPTQKINIDIDPQSPPKVRKLSGSSTDCEDFDILPTQKITTDVDTLPTQKITNDIGILPTQKITIDDDDLTDCEDEFVNNDLMESKKSPEINFEDMATQVLGDGEIEAELNRNKDQTDGPNKGISFEELPTQIITDDSKEEDLEDMPTQIIIEDVPDDDVKVNQEVYSEEIVNSPFKVPLPTPLKAKKTSKLGLTKTSTPIEKTNVDANNPNYYKDTQDIFNDLCSQRQDSPKSDLSKPAEMLDDDELVPCSVEDYEMGDRFRHIENELSPVKKLASSSKSSTPNRNKNDVNKHVPKAATSSDIDVRLKTPKTLKIINVDLPDSQEIKTSVTLKHRSITESSSDTEPEDVSDQDSGTSLGKKKRKNKINAKLDLTKRFEESLPSRILTRVRKPTYKIRDSDENAKIQSKSILKNSLFDSEDSIDAEIISENISRLKGKIDKKKDKDKNNSKKQPDETKKRPESRNEKRKTDKSDEDSNKAGESRSSRSKSKKSEESKSKTEHHDNSKDEKNIRTTRSSRNKKENKGRGSKSESVKDKTNKEEDKRDSKSRSKTRNESKEAKSTRSSKSQDINEKEPVQADSSPEVVRRSRRQMTKENTKTKHEYSTVYLSSDNSVDSPKNLKRPASNELEVPSPKRTRSLPTSKTSSVSTNPSVSALTPVRSEKHRVLFTAFSNDNVRSKLENLGATIVTDVLECTVLVTMHIKRTFKLLCAVGLGRPIVGTHWVQACSDSKTLVDPWLYLIKDYAAEKRFRFSLEETLRGTRNFLRGYNVSSTPGVLPNAQEMKLIVECSGGTWGEGGPSWVVVSSTVDRALWAGLRRRGARVVSTEFILGGVLRQRPDVEATLFGNATNKKKGGSVGEYVCEECGRRCLSRIGLSSHEKSHTRH